MNQIKVYDVFIVKGRFSHRKIWNGYTLICGYLVFKVKYNGYHKAQFVADGHLTDTPLSSVHAGLVSTRCLCTLSLLCLPCIHCQTKQISCLENRYWQFIFRIHHKWDHLYLSGTGIWWPWMTLIDLLQALLWSWDIRSTINWDVKPVFN